LVVACTLLLAVSSKEKTRERERERERISTVSKCDVMSGFTQRLVSFLEILKK
jgi:hypothetical protein